MKRTEVTTCSAYDQKEPSRSRGEFLARLCGVKAPLNLPTLTNFFADRPGKHSVSHREKKATTQRANGKRAGPFECAGILVPDFLMFHNERLCSQSGFHLGREHVRKEMQFDSV
jgi:hypothetical protein